MKFPASATLSPVPGPESPRKKESKFFENSSCIFEIFLVLYQLCLLLGMEVRNSKEGVSFGIQVSHSHRRSNRPWKPNVKRVKAIVDGSPRHVYVCTRCMRSGKVTRAV